MKTRTRRRSIGALALLTAGTWALLPADGQQQQQQSGSARYELLDYDSDSVQVLDRSSGVIYAIKRRESGMMLDPVRGQSMVRKLKVVQTKPLAGKPTWPEPSAAGGPLRYHALRGRRGWRRSTGMFDAKTGKVYLVRDLERYLVLDPIHSTVEEGRFAFSGTPGYSRNRNETSAIGALKTIGSAQSLFREGDKEGDATLDYGTLKELGDQRLIDKILASGTKRGYRFAASYSLTTSEFLWWATAEPVKPGVTGARYFATNHAGVIFYSTKKPIPVDPKTCVIPRRPDVKPVGR